jgi:hypothetical protein
MKRILIMLSLGVLIVEAQSLSSIHKIYVASLGTNDGAEAIRQSLISRLVQSRKVTVVNTAEESDAVLTGMGGQKENHCYRSGAVWGTWNGSANASGGSAWSASAIAQLRDHSGNILWSGEGATGMFRGAFFKVEPQTSKAAGKLVNQLLKALEKARKEKYGVKP